MALDDQPEPRTQKPREFLAAVVGVRRSRERTVVIWWGLIAVTLATPVVLAPVMGFQSPFRVWWLTQRLVELWIVSGFVLIALLPVLRSGRLRTMPRAPGIAAMTLAVVLILVQHGPGRFDFYPIVEWGMYSSTTERIFYTEYLLVTSGDPSQASHVRLDETVPSSMRAFMRQLDGWIDEAAAGDARALAIVEETFAVIVPPRQRAASDEVLIRRCEVRAPSSSQPVRCAVVLAVSLNSVDP